MSEGARRIAAERERQIYEEGYNPIHDRTVNGYGSLAQAAACYAIPRSDREKKFNMGRQVEVSVDLVDMLWPWIGNQWKPDTTQPFETSARIRELEKAGALIAAEIDRLIPKAQQERMQEKTAGTLEVNDG
jgi:hypothetical protein